MDNIININKRYSDKKSKKVSSKLLLFLIIAAGVLFSGCSVKPSISPKPKEASNDELHKEVKEEKKDYGLNETAKSDGMEITITKMYEMRDLDYSTPSFGNIFLILEMEFINRSSDEKTISSMLSFNAYSDSEQVDSEFVMDKSFKSLNGTIAKDKKLRGNLVYEVPENWGEFELYYKPNVFIDENVAFKIKKSNLYGTDSVSQNESYEINFAPQTTRDERNIYEKIMYPLPSSENSSNSSEGEMHSVTDEYIFPYTSSEYIDESEIDEYVQKYGSDIIQYGINELYARHGYKFKGQKWIDFFSQLSWYFPDENLTDTEIRENRFNPYEKENINRFLKAKEKYN